jgi:hypothetical protein
MIQVCRQIHSKLPEIYCFYSESKVSVAPVVQAVGIQGYLHENQIAIQFYNLRQSLNRNPLV